MATHSSILAWRISMDGGGWWATVHGVTKSRTQLSDFHSHFSTLNPRLEDPSQFQTMLAYLWGDGELITSSQNHLICLLDNNDCI